MGVGPQGGPSCTNTFADTTRPGEQRPRARQVADEDARDGGAVRHVRRGVAPTKVRRVIAAGERRVLADARVDEADARGDRCSDPARAPIISVG